MNTSLFELFKIGIGPSSSHTVGPMRGALRFVQSLEDARAIDQVARVTIDLYGSLALTGLGHGTDRAVLLGLSGEAPDTVDPASIDERLHAIRTEDRLLLAGRHAVAFREASDLRFHRDQMYPDPGVPTHPNGMRFTASDRAGIVLAQQVFFSIGGGFIVSAGEFDPLRAAIPQRPVPFPFRSASGLLILAREEGRSIAEIMMANEVALLGDDSVGRPSPDSAYAAGTPEDRVAGSILTLWRTMRASLERGLATEGVLPGGLNVRRRAPRLAQRLRSGDVRDPLAPMDWVTVYAMAVNEENAAGGRVVTAPTNGAAGVIPAIAEYYSRFIAGANEPGLLRYFLTAAAIGILYKENASISGAEVGCQGEVGVACSMAAGGLVAALGGNDAQVEHAAEIAMEHNLGMTCDPIGGLVQIPCIERNGMGAVKAINAARLAMADAGPHKLSLDQVIETMYRTGLDMQSRYKETSLAGLALNVIEC